MPDLFNNGMTLGGIRAAINSFHGLTLQRLSRLELFIQGVSPAEFGAIPGTDHDSGAAIQAAADDVKASWSDQARTWRKKKLTFLGETYRSDRPIDFGGIPQPDLRIEAGTLWSRAEGEVALSMTYANGFRMRNFTIYGDPAAPPAVGLSYGRDDQDGRSPGVDGIIITDSGTDGVFTQAGARATAAEVDEWAGKTIWRNRSNDPNARGFYSIGDPAQWQETFGEPLSDPFRPVPPAGVRHSNINHQWGSTQFRMDGLWSLGVVAVSPTAPAVVSVTAGKLAATGLADGAEVRCSDGNMPGISSRVWTVANVDTAADTFELVGSDATGLSFEGGMSVQPRTGVPLTCGLTRNVDLSNCYLLTFGDVALDLQVQSGGPVGPLRLSGQIERHCATPIRFIAPDPETVVCPHMEFDLGQVSQETATAFFLIEGQGTIRADAIRVRMGVSADAPARGMFAPRGQWKLPAAHVDCVTAAFLPTAPIGGEGDFAELSGTFTAMDQNPKTVTIGGAQRGLSDVTFGTSAEALTRPGFRHTPGGLRVLSEPGDTERWLPVTVPVADATLADPASPYNIAGKFAGRMGWHVTREEPVFALGGAAEAVYRTPSDMVEATFEASGAPFAPGLRVISGDVEPEGVTAAPEGTIFVCLVEGAASFWGKQSGGAGATGWGRML